MELVETFAKIIGLLFFYTFFFLLGGTFLCFMLLVAAAYCISGLFGSNTSLTLDDVDFPSESGADVFAHDTLVIYKKEEYPATVMYQMADSVIDILSITNAQEDFTDLLPADEIARLTVEIEYSHVR